MAASLHFILVWYISLVGIYLKRHFINQIFAGFVGSGFASIVHGATSG
jgi:hypothetical protein